MKEVNKSDETIDENLSRISSTFFWNRNIRIKTKLSRGMALEQTIKELTLKSDLNDKNDFQNTIDSEKLITKYGSADHLKVMNNIKNKHIEIEQLGVRDKKIELQSL